MEICGVKTNILNKCFLPRITRILAIHLQNPLIYSHSFKKDANRIISENLGN